MPHPQGAYPWPKGLSPPRGSVLKVPVSFEPMPSAYPNFLEEGDESPRAAHGKNCERPVALKNEYDPTNAFPMNRNIEPSVRAS